jgi:hypothetical protein
MTSSGFDKINMTSSNHPSIHSSIHPSMHPWWCLHWVGAGNQCILLFCRQGSRGVEAGIRTQDQFVVWISKGRTLTTRPGINLDTYLVPPETVPFSRSLLCAFLLAPQFDPFSRSLSLSLSVGLPDFSCVFMYG